VVIVHEDWRRCGMGAAIEKVTLKEKGIHCHVDFVMGRVKTGHWGAG